MPSLGGRAKRALVIWRQVCPVLPMDCHRHPLIERRVVAQPARERRRGKLPRVDEVAGDRFAFVEVDKLPAVRKAHVSFLHQAPWAVSAATGTTCRSPT